MKEKIKAKIEQLEREIREWRTLPYGSGIVDMRYPSHRKDQIVWREETIKVLKELLA